MNCVIPVILQLIHLGYFVFSLMSLLASPLVFISFNPDINFFRSSLYTLQSISILVGLFPVHSSAYLIHYNVFIFYQVFHFSLAALFSIGKLLVLLLGSCSPCQCVFDYWDVLETVNSLISFHP